MRNKVVCICLKSVSGCLIDRGGMDGCRSTGLSIDVSIFRQWPRGHSPWILLESLSPPKLSTATPWAPLKRRFGVRIMCPLKWPMSKSLLCFHTDATYQVTFCRALERASRTIIEKRVFTISLDVTLCNCEILLRGPFLIRNSKKNLIKPLR